MWKFPDGKMELKEMQEEAIYREIKEELDQLNWLPADILVIEKLKEL